MLSFFVSKLRLYTPRLASNLAIFALCFLVIQSHASGWVLVFSGLLGWVSLSDFQKGIIPDDALRFLALLSFWKADFSSFLTMGLRGSLFFALAFSLKMGYHALRKKDGLGWGDVKFLTVSGLWIPLAAFPSFLFITGMIGVLLALFWRYYAKKAVFPLGPAIAFSLWVQVFGDRWDG
jgi:Flp pilus assembly protein protease CpaA